MDKTDWQVIKVLILEFIKKVKEARFTLIGRPMAKMGDFSYGRPTIYAYGKKGDVRIGKFCSLSSGIHIIPIGEHNLHWVSVFPFRISFQLPDRYKDGHPASKGPVLIGNDVWIGMQTLILSGVTIGDGAVVGARSVVTKDIPPYAIVAGNPARRIGYRFEPDVIQALLHIRWWDWDLKRILENISLLNGGDVKEFIRCNTQE